MAIEFVKPKDIEKRSFKIIKKEREERKISLPEQNRNVIMRVIHTPPILTLHPLWNFFPMP